MNWKTLPIFCRVAFLAAVFLAGCDRLDSNSLSRNPSYSDADIKKAEECWLQTIDKGWGDQVGDNIECKSLANELTTVIGYGFGNGGYDYIQQRINEGDPLPLLADVKHKIEECDVLILTHKEYLPVGHTAVVFYPDLANDTIYYLEQNNPNKDNQYSYGVSPGKLKISENENEVYVIFADCRVPIPLDCKIVNSDRPIVAAPNSSRPSIGGAAESATLAPPDPVRVSVPDNLDITSYDSIINWLYFAFNSGNLSIFKDIIRAQGTAFGPYAVGYLSPGYDNENEVIAEIERAIESSPEVSCVGYALYKEGDYEKFSVVFEGLEFNDIPFLEESSDNKYQFGFTYFYGDIGYELLFITAYPDWAFDELHPCPGLNASGD